MINSKNQRLSKPQLAVVIPSTQVSGYLDKPILYDHISLYLIYHTTL
jgi:hypothetical protein